MEKILDCETVESTYKSLCNILGIKEKEIEDFLKKIDIDDYYEKHPYCNDIVDKFLLKKIKKNYKIDIHIDKVCWFHLARVMDNHTFEEGIYPLDKCINKIWDNLYSIIKERFDENEWKQFRKKVELDYENQFAYLYRMKSTDKVHWGPYAMLVKEVAFNSEEVGNHDYLKIPEIIEDICICFEEIYGINLAEIYIKNSKSRIVKFSSDDVKEYYIGVALYYLYNKLNNLEMSIYCNTCYDGKGTGIGAKKIIKIEQINYCN